MIGDIAGQCEALVKLEAQLPKGSPILLLGDLNDRGWQSKEVIEWAIYNDVDNGGRVVTLDSNHGDLFVDWFRQKTDAGHVPRYDIDVFEMNGGRATLSSYGHNISRCFTDELLSNKTLIDHIKWLSSRPSHVINKVNGQRYLFTHAPFPSGNPHRSFSQFLLKGSGYTSWKQDFDSELNHQWNRQEPNGFHNDMPNTISVFGHNSGNGVKIFCEQYENGVYVNNDSIEAIMDLNKGQVYGICLDTTRNKCLTALDLTNFRIYTEPYPTEARMY